MDNNSYTKLLIHGNKDIGIIDSANNQAVRVYGNARIANSHRLISPYGNVQIKTDQYVFGGSSGYFDGSGDYLYLADSEDWNFGAGDFSIDVWYRTTKLTLGSEWPGLLTHRYGWTNNHSWSLGPDQNNSGFDFNWSINGSTGASVIYTMSLSLNTWYYITVCRQGSKLFFGVNGVVRELVTSASAYYNSTTNLSIGRLDTSGGHYLNGYVDELRISKGICRYTSNFTPPTVPHIPDDYTVLLIHFDGTNGSTSFYDYSLWRPNFNDSILFDGVGDCIRPYNSSNFTFGLEDFTIDFWVYLVNGGHNGQSWGRIFETESFPNNGGIALVCENLVNPARLLLHKSDGTPMIYTDTALTNNMWYHIAVIRYNGAIKLYVNGVAQTTVYYTPLEITTTNMSIGANLSLGESFYGLIDEFRVSKDIARWKDNFSVPDSEHSIDVYENKKRNIWARAPYIYKATASGVDIFDIETASLLNNIYFLDGANSVWANDDYVYIGTSTSGIYRCPVNSIDSSPYFEEYKSYPNITDNHVNYLHGKGDYLCAATSSGVDRYRLSDEDRKYVIKDNVTKCFQTSNGDYYYIANIFSSIVDLDDNIFKWDYCRVVELSTSIPEDDYQFSFTIPITQPDDIYMQTKELGSDIRIIDDKGISVPYYIELWDNSSPPKIWTKLSKDTNKFYIIYGNSNVSAMSSIKNTYRLFDDFDTSALSNNWIFDNGNYSGNTYYISDGIISLVTSDNNYPLALLSWKLFRNSKVEYRFRRTSSSYSDDLDFQAGFVGGTMTYIGSANNNVDEFPHFLESASSSGTVYGTKLASTSFKIHTFGATINNQMSNYDGETLTSSGTLNNDIYRQLKFTYNNGYAEPRIDIDWVKVSSYDLFPPSCVVGRGQKINDVFTGVSELCVVYNDGNGYTYSAEQYGLLESGCIYDIYITENTSKYEGGNVIFLATSWGARIIEEKRGEEINGEKRTYLISS